MAEEGGGLARERHHHVLYHEHPHGPEGGGKKPRSRSRWRGNEKWAEVEGRVMEIKRLFESRPSGVEKVHGVLVQLVQVESVDSLLRPH